MLTTPPPPFQKRRRLRPKRVAPKPAPPALVLVQAQYPTNFGRAIRLTFDRAINIDAIDGSQIIVKDGLGVQKIRQGNASVQLIDPQTVEIFVPAIGDYTQPNRVLEATAMTGIVAVDDGGTWAGATDLPIPFP